MNVAERFQGRTLPLDQARDGLVEGRSEVLLERRVKHSVHS